MSPATIPLRPGPLRHINPSSCLFATIEAQADPILIVAVKTASSCTTSSAILALMALDLDRAKPNAFLVSWETLKFQDL